MRFLTAGFLASFLLVNARATQIDIPGPAGSVAFGRSVTVLPNGNFVITDPTFASVGAVYLYDGATLALISTLTGGTAGDNVSDFTNVKVLSNGNFVVHSQSWDNPVGPVADVGAVTFCSATTGCNGLVSASNSLIGSTAGDLGGAIIVPLPNGNFVVASRLWDNPSPAKVDVGAATFCNGTTGCTGPITAANSLIGSTANDFVGASITVLTNSNYVVRSFSWDNFAPVISDVGAVTFCDGTTGRTGAVSSANSLIGSTASDGVGGSVTALSNGKYVVASPGWDNPVPVPTNVGAATLCNGTTGCTGPVTAANSLIGSASAATSIASSVTALSNGNYVVGSPSWDNPAPVIADVGAATFCDGTTGCAGMVVGAANSLIGGTASDRVSLTGVTALTNGNYVVASKFWSNPTGPIANVGAVTWGNGTGGTVGLVTTSNSLVGGTAADNVGANSVTALSNGNYVVASGVWGNPTGPIPNAGAVTWGNGTGGTVGLVTTSNSLTGGTTMDQVGSGSVVALGNGNYVTRTVFWDNPTGLIADVGAVTFCNVPTGCTGLVTTSNSLVGGTTGDNVGSFGTLALANGNYVVRSSAWDNPAGPIVDAGAVTWGNGISGTVGLVTSGNSLVGSSAFDQLGNEASSGGVATFSNGNYAVGSIFWDNGMIGNAGAVTFGDGSVGTVGPITAANSVLGTVGAGITNPPASGISYDATRNHLFAGRSASNIVSILSFPLQLTSAVSRKMHGATPFDINLPLGGEPGVECRSSATGHSLVFNLSANVVSGSATVTAGTGTAGAATFAGNTMTVPLTGVSDIQKVTVTLNSVTDVNAQVLPSTAVSMNVLLGDTTGNKSVNASDVGATKAQSGAAVSAANFRNDTNVSGSISASDIGQVKAASGHSVP